MSNLLAILSTSANALAAFDQALMVTQNNVANASTPDYAKQSLELLAQPFDPPGLPGGVKAGQVVSTRNQYADAAVRQQTTYLGQQQQLVQSLTSLQNLFDISGNTGITYALNNFFQSASAWAQNPSDEATRLTVLARAGDVAQSFRTTATGLQTLAQNTQTQIQNTSTQINQLVGQLKQHNQQILQSGISAAGSGIDTQVAATLENLSQLVNFTASQQPDGTTTILLNSGTPLLLGDHQFALSASLTSAPAPPATYANAPPTVRLQTSDGTDVTAQVNGGQLGALVQISNTVLPSYLGGADQAGSLNTLAQAFADRVNTLLTQGNISDGPPAQPGVPLFIYDAPNGVDGSNTGTNIALSLAVDPSVTPDQLAAISPGPPEVSNGVPLALSQLANPTDGADEIDQLSYTEFYGSMAGSVGDQVSQAEDNEQVAESLQAQAQNQRQQISGVDLNEEAMVMVEFQRAYEANSRLITVLDQLTQDTINLLS